MGLQPSDCEACRDIAAMGWLGDPDRPTARNGERSHCRKCHAIWKRTTRTIHCVRCHLTFAAPGVLDDHQPFGPCVVPESVGLVGAVNQWGTVVFHRVRDQVPAL